MPKLVISNLVVTYYSKNKNSEIKAVNDLSLTLNEGSFNVIVGPSGCGKTSLLKAIIGTAKVQGRISFGEKDFVKISPQDKNLAYVSQNIILYPTLTIFDNIAFPLKNKGLHRDEIVQMVENVADQLDILHCLTRKPRHISLGQQQKTAIARAIVKNPNIYLFDEPFSNIDVSMRVEMRKLLKKALFEKKAIVLFVTHDISEAFALADNIIIMENGKIVTLGCPKDIYDSDNEIIKAYKYSNNQYESVIPKK